MKLSYFVKSYQHFNRVGFGGQVFLCWEFPHCFLSFLLEVTYIPHLILVAQVFTQNDEPLRMHITSSILRVVWWIHFSYVSIGSFIYLFFLFPPLNTIFINDDFYLMFYILYWIIVDNLIIWVLLWLNMCPIAMFHYLSIWKFGCIYSLYFSLFIYSHDKVKGFLSWS